MSPDSRALSFPFEGQEWYDADEEMGSDATGADVVSLVCSRSAKVEAKFSS